MEGGFGMDTDIFLQRITNTFKVLMKEKLVGIYLHGSLAMGCFNQNKSDIDIIIVAKQKLTRDENRAIAKQLLMLHDEIPSGRGIELSIVLETIARDFVYPTPFEFHYSDYHRERYQNDEDYNCGGFEDPDLAAHFTVIYQRGVTVYGRPIHAVFKSVDRTFYLQSILTDIANAPDEIVDSPVYSTLNLCRVLLFLRQGLVSSKKEGGEWGLNALPDKFHHIICYCLEEYSGLSKEFELEDAQLLEFSEYMLNEIRHSIDSANVDKS